MFIADVKHVYLLLTPFVSLFFPSDGKLLEDSGDLFVEIATIFPSNNYTNFCNQLSIKYAQSQRILKKHMGDYEPAVIDVLNIWEGKGTPTRAKLESALEKANSGALHTVVEKHFAMGKS